MDPSPRRDTPATAESLRLTIVDRDGPRSYAFVGGTFAESTAECAPTDTSHAQPPDPAGQERARGEYVSSSARSPDGNHIAVLVVRERTSKSPLAILAAISGHPVQYQSFRVEFYTRDGQPAGSTGSIRGFLSAYGRLCWGNP